MVDEDHVAVKPHYAAGRTENSHTTTFSCTRLSIGIIVHHPFPFSLTIRIRISFLPNIRSHSRENASPMILSVVHVTVMSEHFQRQQTGSEKSEREVRGKNCLLDYIVCASCLAHSNGVFVVKNQKRIYSNITPGRVSPSKLGATSARTHTAKE